MSRTLLAQPAHLSPIELPPTEQLLRRQPVSACNRGDALTVDVALGDNLRIRPDNDALHLLPTDLQFARRLILRFVAIGPRRIFAYQPFDAVDGQAMALDAGMVRNR